MPVLSSEQIFSDHPIPASQLSMRISCATFSLSSSSIIRKCRHWCNHLTPLSQISIAVISFIAIYLCALQYCRWKYNLDPTSFFFDPRHGYAEGYSSVRRHEAEQFIASASSAYPYNKTLASPAPKFCVGLNSVARDHVRYFPTAVGSLLHGLTPEERQEIYLVLFIAHRDPTTHPSYSEPWMENVADRVLTYALPAEQLDHIRDLENEGGLFREKMLFDYTYLLKACVGTGASYIVMNEDDVIAQDGWYHRMVEAVRIAEEKTIRKKSAKCKAYDAGLLRSKSHHQFSSAYIFRVVFYLRLFYTEEYLGWNREEWPIYLFWSLLCVLLPVLIVTTLRHIHIRIHPHLRLRLPPPISTPNSLPASSKQIILLSLACIPPYILLFFAAGRVSMLPLAAGVHEMPKFGCCAQSLVYPHARAADLIAWYESKKVGFVDTLAEEFAEEGWQGQEGEKGEWLRWALTPSVMQHIGGKSSKGDDFGTEAKWDRSVAQKLWNFAFERNEKGKLRGEHERAAISTSTSFSD